jgi:hypothetical protein
MILFFYILSVILPASVITSHSLGRIQENFEAHQSNPIEQFKVLKTAYTDGQLATNCKVFSKLLKRLDENMNGLFDAHPPTEMLPFLNRPSTDFRFLIAYFHHWPRVGKAPDLNWDLILHSDSDFPINISLQVV